MNLTLKNHILNLWEYMNIDQVTERADLIIAFGTSDDGLAFRAAELYQGDMAPHIIFSGDRGERSKRKESEAEAYRRIALKQGVPAKDISIETKSTNSEENTALTYELTQKKSLPAQSIILVQKPISLRRFRATFLKFWPNPEVKLQMSSQAVDPEDYLFTHPKGEHRINQLVGDLQRLHIYAEGEYQNHKDLFREKDWVHINETNGFCVAEDIPSTVWESWEYVQNAGYNTKLVESYKK